jgi:hypothetical protein
MKHSPHCLLSINNYFYPRGGAEVVFLEQNRMLEGAGWQVVPFAMRHPQNLPTPWAGYFPDEIEFGRSYPPQIKLLQAQRVIFSLQARRRLRKLLGAGSLAHPPGFDAGWSIMFRSAEWPTDSNKRR